LAREDPSEGLMRTESESGSTGCERDMGPLLMWRLLGGVLTVPHYGRRDTSAEVLSLFKTTGGGERQWGRDGPNNVCTYE
jgi:hypothetical protein